MAQAGIRLTPLESIKASADLFRLFGMQDSERITLQLYAQGQRKPMDKTIMNETFKTLQTVTKLEFGKSDDYKRRCIHHIYGITRLALSLNISKVVQTMNSLELIDNILDRKVAFSTSRILTKIVMKGSENDEERTTAMSVIYAHDIEGVFKRCIRDCYTWDRLAKKKPVQPEKIPRMDIPCVIDYYKKENTDMVIFEGYDRTIRNAVGHSSFFYDTSSRRMWYEDRDSGDTRDCSLEELLSLHNKIKAVYQTVLINWQILKINTACINLLAS